MIRQQEILIRVRHGAACWLFAMAGVLSGPRHGVARRWLYLSCANVSVNESDK